MLLIDPKQPTQPNVVSDDTLIGETLTSVIGLTQADVIAIRALAGAAVLVCEPFCIGAIDEAILESFATGAGFGIGATLGTIEAQAYRVHQGQIQPFEERNNGLKYGGAALVAVGAIIAGFFSDVPVVKNMAFAPTDGGVHLSTSFGF